MSFNPADIEYAAGLFEGEGSIHVVDYYYVGGEKRSRKTPQIKVQMAMCDREPLERFASIFDGRINGPYSHSGRPDYHRPQWRMVVDSPPKARAALEAMYPLLSPRRQSQVDAALRGE